MGINYHIKLQKLIGKQDHIIDNIIIGKRPVKLCTAFYIYILSSVIQIQDQWFNAPPLLKFMKFIVKNRHFLKKMVETGQTQNCEK